MTDLPLFIIVIPTFNRLSLLRQTLVSAQKQDYSNLEIIVIDNHSDDGTFEYVQKLMAEDQRICLIRRSENIGPIENPRRVLESVSGKYLLILSDDDLIEPTICSAAVEIMEAQKKVSLYVAQSDFFSGISAYSEPIKSSGSKWRRSALISGKEFIRQRLRLCINKRLQIVWCAVVYRVDKLKEALEGNLLFSPIFSQDLQSMCLTAFDQYVFLDSRVLAHYRVHHSNTSQGCWAAPLFVYEDLLQCFLRVKDHYQDASVDAYFCKYIMFRTVFGTSILSLKKTAKPLLSLGQKFDVPNWRILSIFMQTLSYRMWFILKKILHLRSDV
jgi:glycosyltransferase involved in cell wall biosynthesis